MLERHQAVPPTLRCGGGKLTAETDEAERSRAQEQRELPETPLMLEAAAKRRGARERRRRRRVSSRGEEGLTRRLGS